MINTSSGLVGREEIGLIVFFTNAGFLFFLNEIWLCGLCLLFECVLGRAALSEGEDMPAVLDQCYIWLGIAWVEWSQMDNEDQAGI